ncbi:MAG: nuclear transport factor 2 family protein [Gammaproteobacteria bacterium]
MKPMSYRKCFIIVLCFLSMLQTAKAKNVDEEITDLVMQFHAASTNGDLAFMESITSQSDEALLLGSAPEEFVTGHDAIVAWWEGLFDFLDSIGYVNGGLPVQNPVHLQVGHTDTAAWAVDHAEWNFTGGVVPFRISLVFKKEQGQWKIIQQHFSIAVPNEDLPL